MKKIILSLVSTVLFNLSASGNVSATTDFLQKDFKVTLDWLEKKPQSSAKDFNKVFFTVGLVNEQISSNSDCLSAAAKFNCFFIKVLLCFDRN